MTEQERQESSLYRRDGPTFQDGFWTANITLNEQRSQILQGETKEQVQELMLHFLGQQALEIEKARILLRKTFESQVETEKQREQ